MAMRCCCPENPLLCAHPCPACLADGAGQVAKDIGAFSRLCSRYNETDTEHAWTLLTRARKLLAKIAKAA